MPVLESRWAFRTWYVRTHVYWEPLALRHHPSRGAETPLSHCSTSGPKPWLCCWASELSRYAHGLANSSANNHTQCAQTENLKRPGVHESVPGLGRCESRFLRFDFGFPLVHCLGVDGVGVHTKLLRERAQTIAHVL